MSSPSQAAAPTAAVAGARRPTIHVQQLTWVLAWAVVFCDIGTSVYYVPGILYEQVGEYAPLFVAMVTIGFVLLAFKYVEISWRNPEGGGVVTVASKAFSPRWGALGGMLITVDYFLTSSISATSAFYYVGSLLPFFEQHVVAFACTGILFLAILNVVGIRESATVSLWMAAAALSIDAWVILCTLWHLGLDGMWRLVGTLRHTAGLTPRGALIGFAGAWLAFSGLESIAQLSPTMRHPLHRNIRTAILAVIVTVVCTAPLLTLFSVGLLTPGNGVATERFISELGMVVGGLTTKVAVVMTATTLLLFAANTAIIGGYHVFLALAHQGFLPQADPGTQSDLRHAARRHRHHHRRPGRGGHRHAGPHGLARRHVCLRAARRLRVVVVRTRRHTLAPAPAWSQLLRRQSSPRRWCSSPGA